MKLTCSSVGGGPTPACRSGELHHNPNQSPSEMTCRFSATEPPARSTEITMCGAWIRADYPACVVASADRNALAEAARACTVLRHAHALVEWLGEGKPVTAKGVLRRADVPRAGRTLGITVPDRVRTAADVPDLHRPWVTARELGLLTVDGGKAVPGPAVTTCTTTEDILDEWSRALVAVLVEAFDADVRAEAWELGRVALTVLTTDPPPTGDELLETIEHTVAYSGDAVFELVLRGFGARHPAAIILGVLSAFGAITHGEQPVITQLGRWAMTEINARGAALADRSPTGSAPAADTVCQLKITLTRVAPPCWRRVLVPSTATLGDLHEIIQIALDWDGDHLHLFRVGRRVYGDPAFDADFSEDDMTLGDAFSRRSTNSYVYDLGDNWHHELTLESTHHHDPQTTYPTCTAGRGDTPVEDWIGDGPDSIPFDQTAINTRLAALSHRDRQVEAELNEVVATILTDAYGEEEETTAFECVLDEEIDFPVPATLLGHPVIVTGLDSDIEASTPLLRARCKQGKEHAKASFADLVFRPGTVEAWLHAAYLTYLGQPQLGATPPQDWGGLIHWTS